MQEYNFKKIEKKWQKVWEQLDINKAEDFSDKPEEYILVEFPFPSGSGLHVGHCRSYVALDALVRKKRMEGKNVLFPMGWDAFGLPTENYAIKTGVHPREATEENTTNFKKQQKRLGLSFDWSREVNTTDPDYYKWTQWIFAQLYKNGLAYKKKMPINWCPSCEIGLANEEVIDGCCERCGEEVTKKEKNQWLLKITEYADRLIDGLEEVDFPEKVKKMEKEWIGRSEGAEIEFSLEDKSVKVFTTRPDTIFGATYLVFSPEHSVLSQLLEEGEIENEEEVKKYIEEAFSKSDKERLAEKKQKTGVKVEGLKAKNPANGEEIPVFVADYVLPSYGTGVIMAVPAHDQRDFKFAKNHNLSIRKVVKSEEDEEEAYEGEGELVNSSDFNGVSSKKAKDEITSWLKKKGKAEKKTNYKLRDWIFSRQRYWGEPIPMVKCKDCGWVPVPEEDLPVELPPEVDDYKPTDEGESPLADIEEWVKTECPKCGKEAKRETDVMPNWAGSNWYFLRYIDPKNDKELASPEKLKYWLPVDWYNGGMAHTTLHLLYSRFIYKFLWDIEAVPEEIGSEPYNKRTSHGLVLAEDGTKMSKSKGNVVNPETVADQKGADTLRIYEMFLGPFDQEVEWDTEGLKGASRFLEGIWKQKEKVSKGKEDKELEILLHKTIKKVTEDIEVLKLNTAISSLMIFLNEIKKKEEVSLGCFLKFVKILAPFAPHIAEELWQQLKTDKKKEEYKDSDSVFSQDWPEFDSSLIEEEEITYVVQVNGKVRGKIKDEKGKKKEEIKEEALEIENVQKYLERGEIKKTVFVKNKLINFVVK